MEWSHHNYLLEYNFGRYIKAKNSIRFEKDQNGCCFLGNGNWESFSLSEIKFNILLLEQFLLVL